MTPAQIGGVYFSSRTEMWGTPQAFFDLLDAEFGFTLDVCALASDAKCERYFSPEQDGLSQTWDGVCWMNPPYGREIIRWVRKAALSAQAGSTVVCLVPCRTDTRWWHEWAQKASDIRLIRGRLRYGDFGKPAPFPSAVLVFRPGTVGTTRIIPFDPKPFIDRHPAEESHAQTAPHP